MAQNMRKSYLGLLIVIALVLAAGIIYQTYRFDRDAAAVTASAVAFERGAGTTSVSIAGFRAAEMAYFAAGQGPDFWVRRANDLSTEIASGLAELQGMTTVADTGSHLQAAQAAFADLLSVDKRARTNITGDQRYVASDIVFTDALEPLDRLNTELTAAGTAEAAARSTMLARINQWRLGVEVFGFVVFVVAIAVAGVTAQPAPTPESEAATMAEMIRSLPPAVKNPAMASSRAPVVLPPGESVRVITPPAQPIPIQPAAPAAVAPPPPQVNLPEAAELCVDLARVIDGRDIPALLERAARVLEAKGVIVWVADSRGNMLTPSLAHGYGERILTKLGALETGADNVTSLSYRSMRPQVMTASGSESAGAIAVPLISPSGCTGVLAAEIREAKPPAERIAVARIIAAQLATLLAPQDAAATAAKA
jgi:hypothetical protein